MLCRKLHVKKMRLLYLSRMAITNVMEATVFTIEETNVGDVYFKLVKYMFSVRLTLFNHNMIIIIRYI